MGCKECKSIKKNDKKDRKYIDKKNKNDKKINSEKKMSFIPNVIKTNDNKEIDLTNSNIESIDEKNIKNNNSYTIKILDLINLIRSSPLSYKDKLEEEENKNIFHEIELKDNKKIIEYFYKTKNKNIKLKNGKDTIKNAIDFLETKESMKELELKDEIKIPIPKDYKKPKKEIEENINKLKENNIQIDDYFFDKFDEPETTIILTIINNIKNRDKIFNKDYKYIGINFNKNDKGLFIVIFSFSK